MNSLQVLSPTEQVARHLEQEIINGSLRGELEGMRTISASLGVNHKTVEGAVRILISKGLVRTNGPGKKRSIISENRKRKTLKLNILPYDPDDVKHHYLTEVLNKLAQTGHHVAFAQKSLTELKMDPSRIEHYIKKHPADGWIVHSGSREILQWFSMQSFPSFALFGRYRDIPIAASGPNKGDAVVDAVTKLHALGHQRIVMLVQEEQSLPNPGMIPRVFLDALSDLGIQAGRYNLPHWGKGSESFHKCLDSLFRHTPPTALFIDEAPLFIAAQQYLAHKGIVAPKHISMICHDPSPAFYYCNPEISHISFDLTPCLHRVANWVKHVALGKPDQKQLLAKSEFIRGGTIGPPARLNKSLG